MPDYKYTVKSLGKGSFTAYDAEHYEVAKFGDDPEPIDVYDVTLDHRGQYACNCFGYKRMKGYRGRHKHIRLVRLFKRLGEPAGSLFDLEADGEPKLVGNILGDQF